VLDLGKEIKKHVLNDNMLAWQYNTVGVSDGITMGGEGLQTLFPSRRPALTRQGMRFSLQTREIIADSIETVTCAQHHDACIAIPGCDKNMPGVIMAFARHNRPSLMVYGGSIMPGYSETLKKPINISTCYEKHGAYIYKNLQSAEAGKFSPDQIMEDIEKNACPGAGACGGMYTANTMSTSIEGEDP
jgi:dihydroxy-acid dehydratase